MSQPVDYARPPRLEHPRELLDRIQWPALLVGAGALVLGLIGLLISREHFFRSYLFAYMFWLGIPLGCFGILMLQHLTGGGWGLAIRRFLESGTRLLPLMALLFVPLLFGIPYLYVWSHEPQDQPVPEVMQFKHAYLTVGGFLLRTAIYFALWIVGSFLLTRWSDDQDRTGNPWIMRRMQLFSGPGLLLYVVSVTFATFDWVMSIDPHWYSTIFGLMFLSGYALGTLALMILLLALLWRRAPLNEVITRDHFHDLGNLLLAFTLLWAYMSFSQYLIIWSGNIAEETPYYIVRTEGAYKFIALFLIIFHFSVPFILLLTRRTKRSVRALAAVAGAIVVLRSVDLFWTIIPLFQQAAMHHQGENGNGHHDDGPGWFIWLYLVMPLAVGGFFVAAFIWQLRRRPLLPLHDPRLHEVTIHGAHDTHT